MEVVKLMEKVSFKEHLKIMLGMGPGEGMNMQTIVTSIYCCCYAFSGIFMMKILGTPFPGVPFALAADLVFFVILYIGSDMFSQVWGYKVSRQTAILAAGITCAIGLIGKCLTFLPAVPGNEYSDGIFKAIYGSNIFITICGCLIYFVGDGVNDIVFQKLRVWGKNSMGLRAFMVRSVSSSFMGRLTDLCLFGTIVNLTLNAKTLGLPNPWRAVQGALQLPDWGQSWFVVIASIVCTAILQPLFMLICAPISRYVCAKIMTYEKKQRGDAYDKMQAEQVDKQSILSRAD
jgi:uncharacterized PurR-regulated membrane protein YhhQ (DUF165 family)